MGAAPQTADRDTSSGHGAGFCFAHLSDPHLTSLDHVRQRDLYNKRVLGYLSWRSHRREEHRQHVLEALLGDLGTCRVDHTVITGDLTHLGLPTECVEARVWLGRLGPPTTVTVVPGNHDMYAPDRWSETLAHWVPYMKSDDLHADSIDRKAVFPSVRIRGALAFIGLSSAYPSAPFFATGRVGHHQISELDRVLEQTAASRLVRVLLIHHPPLDRVVGWRKRLRDAASLREVLERHGVELILHGHAHRSTLETLYLPGGSVPVIGVPSASGIGLRPGRRAQYHLYRVGGDETGRALNIEVRGYDPDQDAFVLQDRRSVPLGSISAKPASECNAA